MSKLSQQYKDRITIIALVFLLLIICGGLAAWLLLKNHSSTDTAIEYSSPNDLHLSTTSWRYDSDNNVYYQLGLVYASQPADVTYESLGIFVPGAYLSCTSAGDDLYSCTPNNSGSVGNYTAANAPIVFPVNTPGYSAVSAPTSYNYNQISDYLSAGLIYVQSGARGRNNGTNSNGESYAGGAPWGVTDFKAAIRYLRYNASNLPGNTSAIYAFGHSGGGAQSAILGASGDSPLYTPYLEAIGALTKDDSGNTLSDAVAGVMAWCPITLLDTADLAYEWNMGQFSSSGTRASSTWTSALSADLAKAYASYINSLKLKDENNFTLTLNRSKSGIYTSGTYYDHILSVLSTSLTNYLTDNYSSTSERQAYVKSLGNWASYTESNNTAQVTSLEKFIQSQKQPSKSVGAFDDLSRSQAENYVFGTLDHDTLHFDIRLTQLIKSNKKKYSKFSDFSASISDFTTDLSYKDSLGKSSLYRQAAYNPLFYITNYYTKQSDYKKFDNTATIAPHWRIRTGITQGDTANTTEINLALALQHNSQVKDVDFATIWGQGHTEAERTGTASANFISWLSQQAQ